MKQEKASGALSFQSEACEATILAWCYLLLVLDDFSDSYKRLAVGYILR